MKIRQYILLLLLIYSYIPCLAQVDTAWVRRYDGPANGLDVARSLAIDDKGYVYVTGFSQTEISYYGGTDYATIKYDSNGDTLWVRFYDGPGTEWSDNDGATALAVDENGNVSVTGWSDVTCWQPPCYAGEYATIKYTPNADSVWVRRYKGPGNPYEANALAVDDSGNVYVTGSSGTIKYSPSGDSLWSAVYGGSLAIDALGNVHVTGGGYITVKYARNGDTLWVRRYSGVGILTFDKSTALAVNDSRNVYVTGYTDSDPGAFAWDYDYTTIKYAPSGETLWVRTYNGPGNGGDEASALAVDDSGNVLVTGVSEGHYTTIKYASNGDSLWVRRYLAGEPIALAVDASGNVYVTGTSGTIKYSPTGDSLWSGPYGGYDLALDFLGNVYVTGGDGDYVTIKYVQFDCLAKPGDATGDNHILLTDVVRMINYLFKDEPLPDPYCRADANANGIVTFPDIIYLVNFLFKSGPAPLKSKECCL